MWFVRWLFVWCLFVLLCCCVFVLCFVVGSKVLLFLCLFEFHYVGSCVLLPCFVVVAVLFYYVACVRVVLFPPLFCDCAFLFVFLVVV